MFSGPLRDLVKIFVLTHCSLLYTKAVCRYNYLNGCVSANEWTIKKNCVCLVGKPY